MTNLHRIGIGGLIGAAAYVVKELREGSLGHESPRSVYLLEHRGQSASFDAHTERMPSSGVAPLLGIRDFLDRLPATAARRRELQARRRRTDAEIIGRFGECWLSPVASPRQEHGELHRRLMKAFGVPAFQQSTEALVRAHLASNADTAVRTAEACTPDICRAAKLIAETFASGGKLLLCGNGGSATDCQHVAAELASVTLELERPGLPAIALTTDGSVLTASTSDLSFDGVFARQVQALGRPGDALLAISTSGASTDVLQAVEQARRSGLGVVALTGERGALGTMADVAIRVPATATAQIQEAHLAVEHIICRLVERQLYGAKD
jgi:D-sedoheptulose 7-phosphate isomerase